MSNIIPFDAGLPAYLKQAAADINADITQHASTGFPVISIKGKQFAVVRDGARSVLTNPKDPDSPATNIDVVILKVSKAKSKVFYLKGYDPKESEGKKPDCFSNDGIRPDPASEVKQSPLCATCSRNVWNGAKEGKKGKECSDSVRIAVATPNLLNDPYLLRVPPASIKALGEFGTQLAKRNVPYNAVVTKVGFDPDAESPKLTFKPVGFLDAAAHAQATEEAKGDVVAAILGTVSEAESIADAPTEAEAVIAKAAAPTPISKDKTVTDDEIEAAVAKAEPAKPAKSKAAPAPAPADVEVDLNLDDVSFDD